MHQAGILPPDAINIDIPTTRATATHLMSGIYSGYGGSFASFAWNTPDWDKLAHLEKNVYQFAGAKNYSMLVELNRALKADNGILPFRDFRNKALPILEEYNQTHLKTEYNAAVAGAQMASRWVDAEKSAERARQAHTPEPLLQYRTQEDERVRESHRALNRITRPVDDNFWKTYYPPNGWNCRCTVIRSLHATESSDQDTNRAMADCTPQKGFGVNLAQEGFVFPKNSPYYIGNPGHVARQSANITPDRTKKPKK